MEKYGEEPISPTEDSASGLRRATLPGQTAKARNYEELHKLQQKTELQDWETDMATTASIGESFKSAKGSHLRVTLTGATAHVPTVRELLESGPDAHGSKSDFNLKATKVLRNLAPAALVEKALKNEKGCYLMASGALAALSGAKTGRSPKDKRIVKGDWTAQDVWWGKGSPNIPMDVDTFIRTRERALDYLNMLDEVFVFDGFAGADPESRIAVRVLCGRAYHALFMHNMLIRPTPQELKVFVPDMTIINAGMFPCNRYATDMTSSTCVAMNLKHRELVILGTQYAGEMKKGVFSFMHYLMPKCGILSLHSGCNVGAKGDVTLFFGLSGTGKTTLSTDPARQLVGDDEHCWSDRGIFNIEGGCYAKCIDLSPVLEPEIFQAIRFGAIVENVVFTQSTREVDYTDSSLTENTRAAYPIDYISNALIPGVVNSHPKNLILLCCDAFGVLPPVSRLTVAQAMYHFVSGYTAKVAGTEEGITEPQATFSACFGGAFLIQHPYQYAKLLAEKMKAHGTNAWLVNTGWIGGRYGVGQRIPLKFTRAIVDAIHSGVLKDQSFVNTSVFNLQVPSECPGVPSEILQPVIQWAVTGVDETDFMATLTRLGCMFNENFKNFSDGGDMVPATLVAEIMGAAPLVESK
mmetsp:Transcript_13949/g.23627  ORF Transcript_13949/g.23627 Transcript_13949/m.23627 type:complete len:637 (-) Transcript_13949:631-2541(-)|eukprot:CAMPEP_0198226654 /NCGR_PEP_ID=MMETSP1445-20131203/106087_1 /TAXON_ID=36898 /ORGANISM="Pyramimonas sp., Strain CCMP2087" /LENGTH=636 /DNA_ID=CAMNT_0043906513 /DNA_START=38 /DNA_END=1948 /DNA_ORIENTATION=-